MDQISPELGDNFRSEETSNAILRIYEEYLEEDDKKLDRLKEIVGLSYTKDITFEQLPLIVKEGLGLDEKQSREVALIILREMIYPVKMFFSGIDDAIIKLGGEVPAIKAQEQLLQKFTNREEAIEDMLDKQRKEEEAKMEDAIIYGKIEDLIAKYPELGDCIIGAQEKISLKDMPDMKPMIKYWIKDYKDKVGIYKHSNLDRVQYVCHDKNTRNMNDEERRQLNLIVKSVDGDIELPYSVKMKKIDFSLVEDE
jgi:hypothetical protein